jgi:hypothetical protein
MAAMNVNANAKASENQRIYEKYMNIASEQISKKEDFVIDDIAVNTMIPLYKECTREQGGQLDSDYYNLRDQRSQPRTFINDNEYPYLSTLFINHIDSILDSNSTNPFIASCKNNSVACNLNKNKPCKYCIRYNSNTKRFTVTNKLLNKQAQQYNASKVNAYSSVKPYENTKTYYNAKTKGIVHESYEKLIAFFNSKLIQIYSIIPTIGKLPTSIICFYPVGSIESYLKSYNYSGWSSYRLAVTHTLYDTRREILTYITLTLWPKLEEKKEEDCYQLHWLLATACPFFRGSAGFAKVVLNAALLRIGLQPVKETKEYERKSDWVAILSPTFEEYYAKKDAMFEPISRLGGSIKRRSTRKNKHRVHRK